MIINHNISALNASNLLNRNDTKMSQALERLSSGLKINSAADDAAGMAISQKMRSQIRALDKSSDNALDGISAIQTAEGALSEVEACIQRMRELSVQAANETNTVEDREAIQQEIEALSAEIDRISSDTEFNTRKLLDGSMDRVGYASNSVEVLYKSDDVTAGGYQFTISKDARQAVIVGNEMTLASDATIAADQTGSISVNGKSVEVVEGDTLERIYEKIRSASEEVGIKCFTTTDSSSYDMSDSDLWEFAGYTPAESDIASNHTMVFVSENYGSSENITVTCSNTELADLLGLSTDTITASGYDAEVSLDTSSDFSNTATVYADGNNVTVSDFNGFTMTFRVEPGSTATQFDDMGVDGQAVAEPVEGTALDSKITVLSSGTMTLHVGANAYQTLEVSIPNVSTKSLCIDEIDVTTSEGSQKAITALSEALSKVSAARSKLGAYQNRLESSISNLDSTSVNLSEALSRIEDADMAEEMTAYTQYNVLVQAGTSMLAQANEKPQNILSLLQ